MHSYTIRPVFWTHKINKQGTGPLMIAVTLARKVRYFKTPYRIREGQWKDNQVIDHPNAGLINRALRAQVHELEADILGRDTAGELITSRTLKAPRQKDLFDFVTEVQKNMPAATRRRYTCEANRLKTFAGDRLALKDVTTSFLRDYEQHERKRGMAQNTLNTSFRWVKAILNKARKEGLLRELPEYTTPKYVQSERIYLVQEEREQWLKHWREKKCDGSTYRTLTWFLFGCYTGLRHSDWGQFDYGRRVEGEFLKLRAKKNGRWVVLPIGKTLAEIIDVVKDLPKPLSGDKTRAYLKILAGQIGCSRTVTTHTARHTFGTLCAQLRLPKSVTADLMGISEKVCGVYYHLSGVDAIEQAAPLFGV
jgi:integrase